MGVLSQLLGKTLIYHPRAPNWLPVPAAVAFAGGKTFPFTGPLLMQ